MALTVQWLEEKQVVERVPLQVQRFTWLKGAEPERGVGEVEIVVAPDDRGAGGFEAGRGEGLLKLGRSGGDLRLVGLEGGFRVAAGGEEHVNGGSRGNGVDAEAEVGFAGGIAEAASADPGRAGEFWRELIEGVI